MTTAAPITRHPNGSSHHATRQGLALARWCGLLGTALVLALTSGCASVMRIDNQVQSYAKWGLSALPTEQVSYSFERLPSQASGPAAGPQTELENMAAHALARADWQAVAPTAAALPRWRVQVAASVNKLPRAPWEDPRDSLWPRTTLFLGAGKTNGAPGHGARGAVGFGTGMGLGGLMTIEQPYYQRAVSVVVRDATTAQVVYETSAAHDGRWNDTSALWQAMLDAALSHFPHPPEGVRQVNIDIPR